jgi:hypothetical protein
MVEKETYKGYTIEIHADENPLNPRTEWDNAGTMVCFHRDYNLGDNHSYEKPESLKRLIKAIESNVGEMYWLPLYILDHSGLWMRTGTFHEDLQGWDTSLVGIIYITKEKAVKEFGRENTEAKALACLNSEVETYSQYLSGEVYGYIVKDKDGNETDSCWGFFGDTKYVISEAKLIIDYNVRTAMTARIKKLKNLIQNKVPLIYRTSILA